MAHRVSPLASLALQADRLAKEWVISAYWIHQSLAVVRAADDGVGRGDWERACREAILPAPLPKLTLLLAPPAPEHDAAGAFQRRVWRELRLLAITPGQGPVIRVAGDDEETALTELAGAMDAMR